MQNAKWLIVSLLALLLGCAADKGPTLKPLLSTGTTNTAGVHQIFDEDSFERLDLVTLLDPEDRRRSLPGASSGEARFELERAFRAFYTYGPRLEERRARVQDRVLAASEQRCNTFKLYLKRVETFQSTTTGILSTILGGAGAIVTSVQGARALAGLAGISSGIGAELRQGFFANVASHVVVPGIDLARVELRREMNGKRGSAISDYTVEAALLDAARYHSACSLNAGLDRAGEAVREVTNPGLRNFNLTLGQLNLAQKLTRRMHDDTIEITERDLRIAEGLSTAGRPGKEAPITSSHPVPPALVDRFLGGVYDQTQNLVALGAEINKKIDANESAIRNSDAVRVACEKTVDRPKPCVANPVLKTVMADTPSAEAPVTLKMLLAALPALSNSAYIAKLSATDADLRRSEFELLKVRGNHPEELKAGHGLRQIRARNEAAFLPVELALALLADGIATARKGVHEDDVNRLAAGLAQASAAIDDLKKIVEAGPTG